MNLFRTKKSLTPIPTAEFWQALIDIHSHVDLKAWVDRHFHPDDCRGDDVLDALHVLNHWMSIAIDEGWVERE